MSRLIWIALVAGLVLQSTARAQVTFTKVADSGTAIPGGSGSFTSFTAPSISGSTVAFLGGGASSQNGVYSGLASGGSVGVVADLNTAIPSGTGNFTALGSPAVSGSTVAFVGVGNSNQQGIYAGSAAGGSLTLVVNHSSAIPNGSGTFVNIVSPSISGSTIAFLASGSDQQGIYTGSASGGSLARVADLNTAVPGGTGNFNLFGNTVPSISGSTVAFLGGWSTNQQGVYTGSASGGSVSRVADFSTAIPGGSGNFTAFAGSAPVISGSTVAFRGAAGTTQLGIYTGSASGGSLARVVDLNTPVPGGTSNFSNVGAPAISGSTIAFIGSGTTASQSGIYYELNTGGPLFKLITVNDALDGKTVSGLSLGQFAVDGTSVTFSVNFTDGSKGVYVAQITPVPEPSCVLGLAVLLGTAQFLSHRRAPK
jgi:hypothetical protein